MANTLAPQNIISVIQERGAISAAIMGMIELGTLNFIFVSWYAVTNEHRLVKGIYTIIQIFACCFPGPCFVGLSGYNGCLCKGSQHGRDSLCCYRWSMYWSFCFNFKNTILCYKLSSCSLFSSLWIQPHHWPLRTCLIRSYSSYPPIRRWTRGLESWCTSRIVLWVSLFGGLYNREGNKFFHFSLGCIVTTHFWNNFWSRWRWTVVEFTEPWNEEVNIHQFWLTLRWIIVLIYATSK